MPLEAKVIQFPAAPKPKKPKGRRTDGLVAKHFRYKDLYGMSHRKTVYGRTIAEADAKKRDFMGAVNLSLRMDQQSRSVSSWVDEWLAVYKVPHVSEKRLQAIGYDVDRIKAAIGAKPLKAVTQGDLQAIVNTRAGKSTDAIRKTLGIMTAVFKTAVDNRLLQFSPAIGLIIPKGTTGTHRALEDWEAQLITRTAPGHRFGLAAMLMLFAGLRKGEVAAFNLDTDVDMKAGTLTVSRAVSYVVNQGETKTPKSAAGLRTIPIAPPLMPFLSDSSGFALSRQSTTPISLQALNGAFSSFLISCELILNNHTSRQRPSNRDNWKTVSFRCHDLRHTYATMLYDAGVDVKTAQRWLGHASPELTMRLYTHLSTSREAKSTAAAEAYFANKFK